MTEIRTPGGNDSASFGSKLFGPLLRGLRVGGQGVAEGIGHALGTPGATVASADRGLRQAGRAVAGAALGEEGGRTFAEILSTTPAGRVFNNISSGADRLLPEPEEIQRGFGNDLRAAGLGGAIIPESGMTTGERAAKAATAVGSLAALGSAGAFRAAATRLADNVPSVASQLTSLLTGRGRPAAAAAPLASKPLPVGELLARKLTVRERRALQRGTAPRRFATDVLGSAAAAGIKSAAEDARPLAPSDEAERRRKANLALETLLGPLLTPASVDGATAPPRGAGR